MADQFVIGKPVQTTFLLSRVHLLSHLYRKIPLQRRLPTSWISKPKTLYTQQSVLCTHAIRSPKILQSIKWKPKDDEEKESDVEGQVFAEEEDVEHADGYGVKEEKDSQVLQNLLNSGEDTRNVKNVSFSRNIPQLTIKEKKVLKSYAHRLGEKLKCHEVGQSGVTHSLEVSINDALEANELLKLKVHRTCPDELDMVASRIQEATKSVVVGQIGRTFILYRPHLPTKKTPGPDQVKLPPRKKPKMNIVKLTGWKRNRKRPNYDL